jgi:predicted DNA-binding transcriptional regulator YafY
MNKTDRLLAIILELERNGMQRAEDLAATFETSVRTIYRDVQALSEAGVPIVGAPGQGYSLIEGYFLPPVSFTAEEAVTLLIGINFVEQQFDAEYRNNAGEGRRKIEAVLPEGVRLASKSIRDGMKLITNTRRLDDSHAETFGILRQAIHSRHTVSMEYAAVTPGNPADARTTREIDPYGLVFVNGGWSLVAWCHLRQAIRHFRINRIQSLNILNGTFEIPEDFNLSTYKPFYDRNIRVRVLISPSHIAKAKDSHYFYTESMEEHEDGLLITLKVREPEEVLDWVLGWGSGALVLEPEILRNRVKEEVKKMLERY